MMKLSPQQSATTFPRPAQCCLCLSCRPHPSIIWWKLERKLNCSSRAESRKKTSVRSSATLWHLYAVTLCTICLHCHSIPLQSHVSQNSNFPSRVRGRHHFQRDTRYLICSATHLLRGHRATIWSANGPASGLCWRRNDGKSHRKLFVQVHRRQRAGGSSVVVAHGRLPSGDAGVRMWIICYARLHISNHSQQAVYSWLPSRRCRPNGQFYFQVLIRRRHNSKKLVTNVIITKMQQLLLYHSMVIAAVSVKHWHRPIPKRNLVPIPPTWTRQDRQLYQLHRYKSPLREASI